MRKTMMAAVAVVVGLVIAPLAATSATASNAEGGGHTPVTLCHATAAEGHWVVQSPDDDSVVKEGHDQHQDGRDIIPAFTWTDGEGTHDYPGKNLTTVYADGVTGADVLANGCSIPEPTPATADAPLITEATCAADGVLTTVPRDGVIWTISGTLGATIATASAKPGFTLTGTTVFGPYDLRQLLEDSDACSDEEPPVPVVLTACEGVTGIQYTSLASWINDSRATGHSEVTADGLHVWTEGATSTDKVAYYLPLAFPLKNLGTGFSLQATSTVGSVPPALQVVLSTGQTLVYEPGFYGVGNVWSNQVVPGLSAGMGYTSFGSVNDILAAAPDAQVAYIGFSLGSGVLGDWTITSITVRCHTITFGVPVPTTVTPERPTWVDPCGLDNAHWVTPDIAGIVWTETVNKYGSVVVTATPATDYVFPADAKTRWAKMDSGVLCDPPADEVEYGEAPAPVWTDPCGPDNGFWEYAATDDVGYEEFVNEDGSITVQAYPLEGYELEEGTASEWTEADSNAACPTPGPAAVPTPGDPSLAATGGGFVSPLIPLGAGFAALLGIALTAMAARRRQA